MNADIPEKWQARLFGLVTHGIVAVLTAVITIYFALPEITADVAANEKRLDRVELRHDLEWSYILHSIHMFDSDLRLLRQAAGAAERPPLSPPPSTRSGQ